MRRSQFLTAIILVAALFTLVTGAEAQTRGTIQGYVVDGDEAGVPGVGVTTLKVDTGASRTVFTNETGFFAARALDPGDYTVTASLDGMQDAVIEDLKLLVGQTRDVTLQIFPEAVAEAITVTSAPPVETSRSSAVAYVSEEEIEALPIVGRDFKAFALLAPTVVSDESRGFIHVAGQRGMYSGLNIDGTDHKSAFFGYGVGGEATENDGLVVGQDTVKEFQVVTSGFAPEYGANGGGYVNVITKSGTNTLRGSAFWFTRDDSGASDLDRSPFDIARGRTEKIPVGEFERDNYGLTIGGPIKKDRTHFFFSLDQTDRTEPRINTISTPGIYDAILARGFDSLVAGYNRNADGSATLVANREVDNQILFGKLDHQFSDSVSGSFRLKLTDYERISGYQDEESEKLEDTQSLVASVVSLHGNSAVNEARIQLAEDNLDRLSSRVGEPVEAEIRFRFGDFDEVGKFDFLPIFVTEEKLQIQDNFSYLLGNHDLKFGVDYSKDDLAQLFAGSKDGRYDFRSLEDFLANEDSGVRIYFGNVSFPNYDETQELIGLYAQDTYRRNEKLTLSYGLRFSGTYNPSGLEHILPEARKIPDDENIEPRFGFAYTPGGGGNAVIRGGFGVFHGRTPSLLFASQVQENGIFPNAGRVTVRPGDIGHVPLGTAIDNENPPPGIITGLGFVDPSFTDAEFTRFNLGYERELGSEGWTGGVDLIYAEGKDLQSNLDINRTVTFDEFGRPVNSSVRPNPLFDEQLTRQSIGESEYTAVTLKVGKRFNGRYQLQAHYTWSEDKDTDSNERSATGADVISIHGADRSLWNPGYDWGLSDKDSENRLVVTGFVVLPWDFKISGIFENRAGRPWNLTDTSVDFAYCGFGRLGFDCKADRVVLPDGSLAGRNTERSESIQTLDVRLSKFFEVGKYTFDAFVEVFNLFDDQAFEVAQDFRSDRQRDPARPDTFGLAEDRVNSFRQTQFGLRISFN
ncbi:MAG: carboxypeptidase regulatory-like domain-containing protein [Thermoanaerobaculia bacterium]